MASYYNNIIGYTTTNKPVFEGRSPYHKCYKDFTSNEHFEAEYLHDRYGEIEEETIKESNNRYHRNDKKADMHNFVARCPYFKKNN